MDPNGDLNPSQPYLDTNPQTAGPTIPTQAPGMQPMIDPYQMPAAPGMPTPVESSWQQPIDPMQTQAPLPPASGGKGKAVLVVGLGIVVAIALAGGAWFMGYTSGQSAGKNAAAAAFQAQQAQLQAEEAPVVEDETPQPETQTLDVATLKAPEYIDQTTEGEVGQQLANADGFVLKVTNVERNFQPNDPNFKADPTKELVKINFLMGNTAKDKPSDVGAFSFRLENAAGGQLVPENLADYEGKFDTVKLDPGSQAKGSIVYSVKKDEKPLKFIREQRYRITSQNREVTQKIIVLVAKP